MTEEISWKAKIIYVVLTALLVILLWVGDEGKQPIIYDGSELQHSVGLIDSEDALVLQESVARNGLIARTPAYVMNKGSYTVRLSYLAEEQDSVLELWEQGDKIAAWSINDQENELSADFTLSRDTKQLEFCINYSGKGGLTVRKLSVEPHTLFYTDTYLMIAVILLLHLAGWWYMEGGKDRISKEMFVDGCIVMGVALLATTPLMQTYLYDADDLCYHLARLEGLKDGILDGQIPVNILPEGLRGNGYMNAMYPYLFLYIGAFLRICRVSLAFSYKVLIFLSNLGSACCAYVAVKSMVKSRRSVILAVVLYTLMPYRFTNILSRGDLGETLALIFWPLVIAGLYHLIMGDRKKWYYLVIGFSGVLQSHILSTTYVAAVCALTALLYCVRIVREKRYVELLKAAGLTVLLNAWYVVPFLLYYYKGNLDKEILRWSGYFEQSINLSNMTQSISLYNKQYFSLGLALLCCLGIGVIYLLCERYGKMSDTDGFLLYLLVLGAALVFMSTGYFPSRALAANSFFNNIATMLQFPWRFLGPASACFVFVGAAVLERSEMIKPYRNAIFTMLIGLNLLVIVTVPAENNHVPYKNAEAVASKGHETKLATSVGLFYPHEWRLIGVMDDKLTSSVVVSDIGSVSVRDYQKEGTKAAVAYTAASDRAYIELPLQNYLGYRASDELGNPLEITQGEGGRMRFMVKGDGAEHRIYVRYGPVAGFVIANVVSALTIFVCLYRGWLCKVISLRRQTRGEELTESDEA
ncbi:MAG: hypothetical protein K2N43_02110 [Lachnospiraceae bacterium]|nr:hypothetical protein [Lachnospiraceae bacterium]